MGRTDEVRVRIAPAPTGHMHLGNARTALFNWLFARHHGGKFIVRIDDTDLERSSEEAVKAILDALRWLGMDWDEGPEVGGPYGPYIQSQRLDIYREYAKKLVEGGKAYYCYCTKEELDAMREEARKRGRPFKYPGKCRNLTPEERERFEREGRRPTIRLNVEAAWGSREGKIVVHDLVLGDVEFDVKEFDDFIIMKSNGMPVYNFATVVDDYLMRITHVIRASEHLSNTPKQILIYKALGVEPPKFAHVPMVLGSSKGEKLSKRHGAVAVEWYRDQGYLPEAMINFLARLGWSYDDKEEIFTVEELIEKFDLDRVGRSGSVFDINKLNWLNKQYIMMMPLSKRTDAVIPFLERAGLIKREEITPEKRRWLEKIVEAVGDRMTTLADIVDYTYFFFTDEFEYSEEGLRKWLSKEGVPEMLEEVKELLAGVEPFERGEIERALRGYVEGKGLKAIRVFQPIRVAITGKTVGPGLFETIELLGRERTLGRLERAIRFLKGRTENP
ncbi:glutamate--tRNA ligase [Candidatus Poribacteria bacterium]|nr:MAG: glutamate--tRNA ligase [Candidatus Poribacteria bacterium]